MISVAPVVVLALFVVLSIVERGVGACTPSDRDAITGAWAEQNKTHCWDAPDVEIWMEDPADAARS
jgi:hypothetical protein